MATTHQLKRLIHNYEGTDEDPIEELKKLWEDTSKATPLHTKPHTVAPNPEMDAPLSIVEIEAAAHHLARNTTPGNDKISNKLLRNLDTEALETLLNYINEQ